MCGPPDSPDIETNRAWRNAARDSLPNPKLLRSRYWKRYNNITIPLQINDEFYVDAITAAYQLFSRAELEARLEKIRQERTRELEDLIIAIWKKTLDSGSANINDAAAEVLERGSLASMLKMICGFVFGWDGDDATPLERDRQRSSNARPGWGNFVPDTLSEEELRHVDEHSDEDWDRYMDDDHYRVRECEDSEEEVATWRFNRAHGIVDDGGPDGYDNFGFRSASADCIFDYCPDGDDAPYKIPREGSGKAPPMNSTAGYSHAGRAQVTSIESPLAVGILDGDPMDFDITRDVTRDRIPARATLNLPRL
ncbi:hypothetical protein NLG97_g1884 [Lecanicillium saksenae]|uniref:Uncharacterized protein n=1 Tax=Lecanicillium saksenae TaxID=468837 RepID=A0ACC1R2I6_9HYPO|nr:hypothetical protein NLG97_g1884 [Lecanicillium saksenae]